VEIILKTSTTDIEDFVYKYSTFYTLSHAEMKAGDAVFISIECYETANADTNVIEIGIDKQNDKLLAKIGEDLFEPVNSFSSSLFKSIASFRDKFVKSGNQSLKMSRH
jgi:hypothetical protein